MTARKGSRFYKGADFYKEYQATQQSGDDRKPTPLTDFSSPVAELRDRPGGTLVGTGTVTFTDAANGKYAVSFPRAVTALIVTPTVAFDVFAYWPDGRWKPMHAEPVCPVDTNVTEAVG